MHRKDLEQSGSLLFRILRLPFPSPHEVPECFAIDDYENSIFYLSYMGREAFATVWSSCLFIKNRVKCRRSMYVYGTNGYGKSHILGALACLLVRHGLRVVYFPDCRAALCGNPALHVREILLLTFGDSKSF